MAARPGGVLRRTHIDDLVPVHLCSLPGLCDSVPAYAVHSTKRPPRRYPAAMLIVEICSV